MPDFVRVNGRLHHYSRRQGEGGRGLVFANSLGTDMRIWDAVIEKLPVRIPAITYDMSGHGLSQTGAVTLEDFAADLGALMDALGVKDAIVCGVSFGGMIAQALAHARPNLVAGLVLCNTGHRIGSAESWADRIAAIDETGLDALADAIMDRWFSPRFRQRNRETVAGYRLMLTRTPEAGYKAVCAAIRDADLTEKTCGLTCPTLCISGENDLATPPEVVDALAGLITGTKTKCYDEVGHLPCIEAPDRLARDIVAHLKSLR